MKDTIERVNLKNSNEMLISFHINLEINYSGFADSALKF